MEHIVIGGVHLFNDIESGVSIRISHLQRTKAYTMGNVSVEADRQDLSGMMFYGTFRLNEDKDKRNAIYRCSERSRGVIDQQTWDNLIEQACTMTDIYAKGGEEEIVIAKAPITNQDDFLLYPLILSGNRATMLYAHGGSMKTYLAGYCAMLVGKDTGVLVLDWETDHQEWIKRMHRIADGLEKPLPDTIIYRRKSGRLSDDGERIHELVATYNIGLVIVDSVSGAVQGDLNDAAPAMALFDTLGQIGVPALLIHHTNKSGDEYGNVYFHNYVRLQWEAHAERSASQSNYTLTLTPKKANVGPLVAPRVFDVQFNIKDNRKYTEGDSVTFKRRTAPAVGTDGFKSMPLSHQITQHLLKTGGSTVEEIATALEIPDTRMRSTVADMVLTKKLVELPNGKYGVVQHG